MGFLTRTPLLKLTSPRSSSAVRVGSSARVTLSQRQSLFTASRLFALKESDRGNKDKDNLHEEIEHHKQDQLEKQKQGKGHWKSELASDSEDAIKADRDEHSSDEEHIGKLQQQTKESAESEKK